LGWYPPATLAVNQDHTHSRFIKGGFKPGHAYLALIFSVFAVRDITGKATHHR
jgi:hypothetical protein